MNSSVYVSRFNNIKSAGQIGVWAFAQATKAILSIYTIGLMLSISGAVFFFRSQMTKAIKIGCITNN